MVEAGWISCNDGLPDDGQEVLAWCPVRRHEVFCTFDASVPTGQWGSFTEPVECLSIQPTHWMPRLPAPVAGVTAAQAAIADLKRQLAEAHENLARAGSNRRCIGGCGFELELVEAERELTQVRHQLARAREQNRCAAKLVVLVENAGFSSLVTAGQVGEVLATFRALCAKAVQDGR